MRTSFIVGFPGETEKEFEELCEFVREAKFDWMGAFGYSDQEGAERFRSGDKKLSPSGNRTPAQAPDADPAQDQQEEEESSGGKRIRPAFSKAHPKKAICCYEGRTRCTPRKSTAKFS